MNTLYYGDNLDVLRRYIHDETVDLVYLDPPFKSDANYNVLFAEHDGSRSAAQIHAFEDTWQWDQAAAEAYQAIVEAGGRVSDTMQAFRKALGDNDLLAYLSMMAPRLVELQRVLKQTGSIYLHCDPAASHYLKMLMDAIFGPEQFRNEIIWRRTGSHNSARRYGPIHDVLLYYTKSDGYYFKKIYRPYMKGHVESYFKQEDERGRYWTNALTGPGTRSGASGKPWKGYNPTGVGRHWAIPGSILEELGLSDEKMTSQEKLDAIDAAGYVDFPAAGSSAMPTYRQYAHDSNGMPIGDIWAYQPHTEGTLYESDECIDEDVRWLVAQGDTERLGYQTQKPIGLLRRIINSSAPEGATILDPFCGCGTTIVAAQELGRPWIGIDITHLAIGLIKHRLHNANGIVQKKDYSVIGEPIDLEGAQELASTDPFQFQAWALGLAGARVATSAKKGTDKGIDGRLIFHDEDSEKGTKQIIFSVKAGHTNVGHVRDLRGVIEREKAAMGVLISMEPPTKPMKVEAAGAGFYKSQWTQRDHPRIQVITVEELLAGKQIDMPPIRHTNQTVQRAQRAKKPVQRQKRMLEGD